MVWRYCATIALDLWTEASYKDISSQLPLGLGEGEVCCWERAYPQHCSTSPDGGRSKSSDGSSEELPSSLLQTVSPQSQWTVAESVYDGIGWRPSSASPYIDLGAVFGEQLSNCPLQCQTHKVSLLGFLLLEKLCGVCGDLFESSWESRSGVWFFAE